MALFNLKKRRKTIVNRAGGIAFDQAPEMKLASLLITSFAQDQFYRSARQTFGELKQLLTAVDPLFAAKAAVYARKEMGMRSITHVLASELAPLVAGQEWAKDFYRTIVKRPDDMLEITAHFLAVQDNKLPNAMKKGFAKAFDRFDAYQLAKYRGEQRSVKLIDLVNLVHPVPTERNAEALRALVNGELKSTGTWEAKLTQAGQKAENEDDKVARKAQAWTELIGENKLGYFALLRNLRNIAEQAPEVLPKALTQLTDRRRIKKSLVLPFRFLTAMDEIKKVHVNGKRAIQDALVKALEVSLDNVPRFEGRTLVVLDDSGSMTSKWRGENPPIKIGAVFAAVLYKSNDADLMRFSDRASYANIYAGDAVMTIANRLIEGARSAGTNFHAIFEKAKQAYDRMVILSDMQGWVGHYHPGKAFAKYKQRFSADPYVYSFDLQGYGSLQFPADKVFALAGFSDKVFDIMQVLEQDPKALITRIERVSFSQ